MPNTYIDQFTYLRNPSGLEHATLLGNSMRLSQTTAAGAVAVNVSPATTVNLNQYDRVTIFDGPNSEVVIVGAAGATVGSSSIPVSALQYQHVAGTPLCSDGTLGSLADQILTASSDVENITKQVLWSTTQTETIRMPTMRASFDNQGILTFRTQQYPITAINAIALGAAQGQFTTYDATQAFIDVNEIVTVPVLNATGGASAWSAVDRTANRYLQVTYTAGYTQSNLPYDVVEAACLLTSVQLARRYNPTGAAEMSQGHQTAIFTMRGDLSGELLNYKQAKILLDKYALRMF